MVGEWVLLQTGVWSGWLLQPLLLLLQPLMCLLQPLWSDWLLQPQLLGVWPGWVVRLLLTQRL